MSDTDKFKEVDPNRAKQDGESVAGEDLTLDFSAPTAAFHTPMAGGPESKDTTYAMDSNTTTSHIAARYEILGLLGSGGMGNVYKVRDMELDEVVALKTLHDSLRQNEQALQRFRREVKLARRVTHPNVARTFDLGTDSEMPYLTMEFVEGDTLYTHLNTRSRAKQRLTPGEVLHIVIEVARGLDAAHQAGVIHRDLKPANIILTHDQRIVITDFGIARISATRDEALTAMEGMVGTPLYMSPEQVEGKAGIDHRTDLYALGVMFFEMLTGRPPFTGDSPVSLALARILHEAPSLAAEGYPDGLSSIIARLLERNPEHRHADARALIAELEILQQQLSSLSLPSPMFAGAHALVPSINSASYKPKKESSAHKTMAILPMNHTVDGVESSYLYDGFTEELVGELSVVPNLRVRPLGVIQSLLEKTEERDPILLGKLLEVDVIITGTIREMGEKLRIRLSLISVQEGFQIWGEKFMSASSELFLTAEDAAEAIAEALTSKVQEERRPEPLTDPIAVDAYMRGRYLLQHKWFEGVDEAIAQLTVARDRAPDDPRILTAMATAMARQVFFEPRKAHLLLKQAQSYAQRATDLVPGWPEPYYAMAMVAYAAGDFASTITSCQQALELTPEHIEANDLLGRVLAEVGPLEEAIYHLKQAVSLNETLYRAWWDMLRVYGLQGDWAKVDELIVHARRSSTNHNATESFLFRFHCWRGAPPQDYELNFAPEAQDERFQPIFDTIVRYVQQGRLSREHIQELHDLARQMPSGSQPVRIFLQLCAEFAISCGYRELAYRSIEAALNEGLRDLMWLQYMPLFDPLRGENRFKALLSQAHMTLAPVRATLTPHSHGHL